MHFCHHFAKPFVSRSFFNNADVLHSYFLCLLYQIKNKYMKITKQEITVDNVFEQMALVAKQNLVDRGILPEVANKIAIDFTKERGMKVLKQIVKDSK